MLQNTTAIKKISSLKKRIKIVQGGTSAGKTFGILPILINIATSVENMEISVVSESIPHLRRGALKDFLKIMRTTNRYVEGRYNKSLLKYNFANGSYIEFFSADDSSKLRGSRRDILYVNECNGIDFNSYTELSIRTKKSIFLDFNPANEFWVHTELVQEDNSDFIILTYRDNEALDESIVRELEKNQEKAKTSNFWKNWCKVYIDGEIGNLEGIVFENWKQISQVPEDAKFLGYGLDFGYTNDPTSIVEVYSWNGKRVVNEICYNTQMVNSDIANRLEKHELIIADSAEPKSIEEIKRLGYMIKGCTKGRDSILYGVQLMQSQEYLVTSNSLNLIKELRGYVWDSDKTGKRLNKPKGGQDHAIDALRYFEMESLSNKNNGTYYLY